MLKNFLNIYFETEPEGSAPAEPATAPETTPEPADSGRGVDELKASIKAMTESLNELKSELQRKDPEATEVKADFGAYFKDFMK